ncbi:hypothetical protein [Psychrobacter sp. 72-O-c]|uniref:hypothetical protein n=1 Tax=Psychrobacter sp. 72-O-c TaxID=2774125 RepID=UPI001918FCB2|nr:hypothetical protein [Psychrobacter sp. 72-O-c]
MSRLWYQRLSFPAAVFTLTTPVLVALTGCSTVTPNSQNVPEIQAATAITPAVQTVVGDYASDGYDKRQQGYDWVGVMIQPYGVAEIEVKVRARGDIKQPSCHFDGKATLLGQDDAHGVIFQTIANDSVTFLQFKDGLLTIDSQDKYALNYFCSGGGTLAGDYQKLEGHLNIS